MASEKKSLMFGLTHELCSREGRVGDDTLELVLWHRGDVKLSKSVKTKYFVKLKNRQKQMKMKNRQNDFVFLL